MLQLVEPCPEKNGPCGEEERGPAVADPSSLREARQTTGPPPTRTLVVHGLFAVGLSAAAAAAVIFVPFLEPIRDRFARTEPGWVAAAFVLQVLSMLSFVAALRGAFDRRLGWRDSFDIGVVEESANVMLPSGGSGGLALGAVLMIRSGIPTPFAVGRSMVLFLVTSGVGLVALVVFGLGEAVGVLPGHASLAATLIPALGGALVIALAIVLARRLPRIDPEGGGRVRRALAATQGSLSGAVDTSLAMIARGDALLIGGAIGYFAFDAASMGASFEALGGGGPALGLFVLAYVIGHGGAIVPVPGSAEGGLVGAFTLYGTALSLTAGGVLVYRTFHAGVPFLLAVLGLADLGRRRRERAQDGAATERQDRAGHVA